MNPVLLWVLISKWTSPINFVNGLPIKDEPYKCARECSRSSTILGQEKNCGGGDHCPLSYFLSAEVSLIYFSFSFKIIFFYFVWAIVAPIRKNEAGMGHQSGSLFFMFHNYFVTLLLHYFWHEQTSHNFLTPLLIYYWNLHFLGPANMFYGWYRTKKHRIST